MPDSSADHHDSTRQASDDVALPVMNGSGAAGAAGGVGGGRGQRIKSSRSTKWRFAVLGLVQLLIALHIVLWLWTGTTTTPVEPSEAMAFTKYGIINVGLILFGLALLSTAVLGRWFCGWGCHVLLLQDGCGWLLKKMGLRPRPFRSRLLLVVPLLLGLYMFIWPAAYRVGHWAGRQLGWIDTDIVAWQLQAQFTTSDFWEPFPPAAIAIPFLLICGFATVYFLGSKGYCTYACPYGGLFRPLDRLSPMRIRVTDACQQCGHCTAVCSSNVRVHEEVRDYGMVVDPGCMKCLDCVSVCPNDALYVGLGKPAILAGKPKTSLRKPNWDLSLRADVALLATFVVIFMALRGVYNVMPLLFASGFAAIATFFIWKAVRVLGEPNASFHRWRLKFHGRMQPAGWMFIAITSLLIALVVHSGVVNAAVHLGHRAAAQISVQEQDVFSPSPVRMTEADHEHADRALWWYRLASSWREGGIGLLGYWQGDIDFRIATIHTQAMAFDRASDVLERAAERDGMREEYARSLRWLLAAQARSDEALAILEETAAEHPEYTGVIDDLAVWYQQAGRTDDAIATLEYGLAHNPDDLLLLRRLSLLLLGTGEIDRGIEVTMRTLEIEPDNAFAYRAMGLALAEVGRLDEARAMYEQALAINDHNYRLHGEMAEVLALLGEHAEGDKHAERGQELFDALPPDER